MEGGVVIEEEGDYAVVPAEARKRERRGGREKEKGGFRVSTSLRE